MTDEYSTQIAHLDPLHLQSILQAIPDPLLVMDLEGFLKFVNPAFTTQFEWQADDSTANLYDVVPEAHQLEIQRAMKHLHAGQTVAPFEIQWLTGSRGLINVTTSTAAIKNETGQVTEIVMILRDVTTKREIEASLKECDERHHPLMEAIPEPVVVYDMEGTETNLEQSHNILDSILSASPTGIGMIEDFAFKWVNNAVIDMFGFRETSDYENQPIEMVFSSHSDFSHIKQESCEKLKMGEVVKYDTTFRRKDGSIFIGHLKMSSPKPAHPEERIIFAITDITWRRIAEADVASSQNRYRSVFENTGTATVIIDENMIITMANNMFEELSGYQKIELEHKKKWTDFVVPEDLDRILKYHQYRLQGRDTPTEYEFKLINRESAKKDILLRVGVIPSNKEVVASLTDITSRKEMESELKKANQALNKSLTNLKHAQAQLVESEKMAALGGLVAGVAHEINTPIGVAITAASFLEIKTRKHQEAYKQGTLSRSLFEKFMDGVSEASSIIHSNLKRAAELVNSFKQVAVDQSSEGRRKFNIKSYIDEILLSLGPKFKRTEHKINITCPADLEIDSYPGAFYQIITNLLMNSLLHGFETVTNGIISFEIKRINNQLKFIYRDNGSGMHPPQVKRIFDPFFTTKRGQGGSGLGMHIVYNLVSQTLNGEIECKSAPGEGMMCQIKIPVASVMPEKQ